MSSAAAASAVTFQFLQALLLSLDNNVGPDKYMCPVSSPIDVINNMNYDYVIVGAGVAGSILAHRLSETNAKILLLEEGGCPPLESNLPGYFTLLMKSRYDRNLNIYNDGFSRQNLFPDGGATAGKMFGGSSSLGHMIHFTPVKQDFDNWVSATDDYSWAYDNMIKYIVKSEAVLDKDVLAQNTSWHGTSGPTLMKTQKNHLMEDLISAYEEIGIPYKADIHGCSVTHPLLTIEKDKCRQSAFVSYLSKNNRSNLHVLTGARATKILFNGIVATGVQYTYKGVIYKVLANRTIISAGTLLSPQLLMLSGIGDEETLSRFDIETVVNNPYVGQNLMDNPGVSLGITLNSRSEAIADPHEFPTPLLVGHGALGTSDKPMRQDVWLRFSPNSTGFLELCTGSLKYLNKFCDAWHKANVDKDLLYLITDYMYPESKGYVTITSADINDQPEIAFGLLSNRNDLENFGLLLEDFAKIINTTALQALGAEFVDIGVCNNYTRFSLEFWECYIVEMSTNYWSFIGTCSLGKVVDNRLNVIGTTNLKIIDASTINSFFSGKAGSYVRAMAERAADIIKEEDGLVDVA